MQFWFPTSRNKQGFLVAQSVKNLAFSAGDLGSTFWSGRSLLRKENGNPLQYPCLENFMNRGPCDHCSLQCDLKCIGGVERRKRWRILYVFGEPSASSWAVAEIYPFWLILFFWPWAVWVACIFWRSNVTNNYSFFKNLLSYLRAIFFLSCHWLGTKGKSLRLMKSEVMSVFFCFLDGTKRIMQWVMSKRYLCCFPLWDYGLWSYI